MTPERRWRWIGYAVDALACYTALFCGLLILAPPDPESRLFATVWLVFMTIASVIWRGSWEHHAFEAGDQNLRLLEQQRELLQHCEMLEARHYPASDDFLPPYGSVLWPPGHPRRH